MSALGLSKSDEGKVLQILKDLEESVRCDIGITGSLAQRFLSPAIADAFRGKPLNDADFLLIGTDAKPPELPKLRELFRVLEVIHSGDSWYYGTVHRRTGLWVDLFSPFEQRLTLIEVGGKQYPAGTLESQILYLARDILRRSKTIESIRPKWQSNLSMLSSLPQTNWEAVEQEYRTRPDYFESVLSPLPENTRVFIDAALKQKATSWLGDKFFLVCWGLFLRRDRV